MAEETESKNTDVPTDADKDVSPEKPAEKAGETPAKKAGETPAEKPAKEPAEASAEESAGKPAEAGAGDSGAAAAAEGAADDAAAKQKPVQAKGRSRSTRVVTAGIAHIRATFNNTMVSITDTNGGVVSWSTAGRAGFKGSRKSTAFAATLVGQDAARQAVGKGMREVEVRVQGAGAGRESAIRALQASGLNITLIKDVTPMPHNGCRARKRRRV